MWGHLFADDDCAGKHAVDQILGGRHSSRRSAGQFASRSTAQWSSVVMRWPPFRNWRRGVGGTDRRRRGSVGWG